MGDSVEHYLPTVERAHAEKLALPPGDPANIDRVAALTIYARITKRTRAGATIVDDFCESFVPGDVRHAENMFKFEGTLEARLDARNRIPPPCLRCPDLRPRHVGSAYRDGGQQPPDFHGFRYGDAVDDAFESVSRFMLGGQVLAFDIAAYARPLLWLRYARQPDHVLMVGGTDNKLCVVFTASDDE